MKSTRLLSALTLIFIAFAGIYCNSGRKASTSTIDFLNLNDTVQYVGITACKSCHKNIYETFIQTGMGQSFDVANPNKSVAEFGAHALVYDEYSDFYYKPFWDEDTLFIMEFRLDKEDTVHKRIEKVKYIIGSGQHTNSHIVEINGFLFQAPITFYTQKKQWDLAPGYEKGFNSRFSRAIGLECMTCHNALPQFAKGSENKYYHVPVGIDCERCHGPGALHVREKLAGVVVDTSRAIDYTIVNPAHLNLDLQMSLCQRCHLQGIAVLEEGKSFEDFKPGKHLSEVMNVFLPRYEGAEDQFIMASQADRLRMSQCFKQSKKLSCITCHNPHISVLQTNKNVFNQNCQKCHANNNQCSEDELMRVQQADDCVHCHMPKSESIDIPHVSITDHFISVPSKTLPSDEKEAITKFLGLVCLTQEHPSPKTVAEGYLAFYEKYSSNIAYLDSAEKYIIYLQSSESILSRFNTIIRLYFLKEDYQKVTYYAHQVHLDNIHDAWTIYRIGEGYYQLGQYKEAMMYYEKAVELMPLNVDYLNKLGSSMMALNDVNEAKRVFEQILALNPKHTTALSNLGFISLNLGQVNDAETYYNRALALDPDYEQALMNKAGLMMFMKQPAKAATLLKRVLDKNPGNQRARSLLRQMQKV